MLIAALAAITAAGLLTALLALYWPTTREDDPIELRSVYRVRGIVYRTQGTAYGIAVCNEEFVAANRTDAARQFGDHVRAHGRWVRKIESIKPAGVVCVPVSKPAA